MATINSYNIVVDIKAPRYVDKPNITVNDLAEFVVTVMDKNVQLPLTGLVSAELMNIRPDLAVVAIKGTIEGNAVRFDLSKSPATSVPGEVRGAVQLNYSNGKITSLQFTYNVNRDPLSYHAPTPLERSLIQIVLEDGPVVIADAKKAVTQANSALATANQANVTAADVIARTEAVRASTDTVKADTLLVKQNTEQARLEAVAATKYAKDTADVAAGDARRIANDAATYASDTADESMQALRTSANNTIFDIKAESDRLNAETRKQANEVFTDTRNAADKAITDTRAEAEFNVKDLYTQSQKAINDLRSQANLGVQTAYESSQAAVDRVNKAMTDSERLIGEGASAAYQAKEAAKGITEIADATRASGDYAKAQGDFAKGIAESIRTKWLAPVATFAELATKYPKPNEGDTVNVTGEARIYKYSGGAWVVTDEYNANAIGEIAAKVNDTSRQTQLLQNGANVLNADVATPVDFEVQGRTLVSLANTNLEALKYYALADKKTKIAVDNTIIAGVGKFQKKSTTLTVADFAGKVSGSTTANPHKAFRLGVEKSLIPPQNFTVELGDGFASTGYGNVGALDAIRLITQNSVLQGAMAIHMFSFNVVEQIERQLGLIPKATLAEKVAWIKENLNRLTGNWHGFGSSVGGNKAQLKFWEGSNWRVGDVFHTNGIVTKLSRTIGVEQMASTIDSNGFVHFLAYSEPSDGTTEGRITTDYINLEIELKATAQLNTRGRIIRVENFEGKVSGSTVENPHIHKRISDVTLKSPQQITFEPPLLHMERIGKLDGVASTETSILTNGMMAQQLFSFNLIEAVERNVGKIPAADVAGKVAWIKANVSTFTGIWRGFGSGPSGNRAKVGLWYVTGSIWLTTDGGWFAGNTSSTSNAVSQIKTTPNVGSSVQNTVDSNGFAHFLAYAEPSDGVTASTINTDYIELEIELKPDADFRNPKVPLYEVAKEDFDKIGTTWTEDDTLKRFPVVEGPQHLVNPYLMAEGENLIPPFTEWNLHANARIVSPYELELVATAGSQDSWLHVPVISGRSYFLKVPYDNVSNGVGRAYKTKINGHVAANLLSSQTTENGISFTVDESFGGFISLRLTATNAGTVKFTEPMLSLGTTAKPFTPRNPSYLFAETKLGAIGTAKDSLFRQDGQWKRRKVIEKDIVLDGSFVFSASTQYANHRAYTFPLATIGLQEHFRSAGVKWNGEILSSRVDGSYKDAFYFVGGKCVITVHESDVGLKADLITIPDINRYFNGWKYTDGVTWTSVTGNGQTATAQQALDTKPTDHTPYKLSYVLATPVIENVTVEGEIIADGLTQIEAGSGMIVREKVVPIGNAGKTFYYINSYGAYLKNRASKIISIQKNGEPDTSWTLHANNVAAGYAGGIGASNTGEKYDTTAEYTVTYLAEKPKFTVNPVDIKAVFAKNIRSAVDDIANRFGDAATRLSIAERAIVDLYVKLKALGAK